MAFVCRWVRTWILEVRTIFIGPPQNLQQERGKDRCKKKVTHHQSYVHVCVCLRVYVCVCVPECAHAWVWGSLITPVKVACYWIIDCVVPESREDERESDKDHGSFKLLEHYSKNSIARFFTLVIKLNKVVQDIGTDVKLICTYKT